MNQIPTIINGVILPSETKKSLKYESNKVRRTQPSNSGIPRVPILIDSHLRVCTKKIEDHLGNTFRISGFIKPGASTGEMFSTLTMEVVGLNSHDVIVLCTGANNIYMNNSNVAILKIIKFVTYNSDTNIIIIGVPHRYDLSDHSCINKAIQSFNGKLKNITKKLRGLSPRADYTDRAAAASRRS